MTDRNRESEEKSRYYAAHPDRKRPVYVRVDKFTGYGRHVHVTMREADDPGKGKVRVMKFTRPEIARRWIETTFDDEFDEETHELVVEKGESYNWFYGEGD